MLEFLKLGLMKKGVQTKEYPREPYVPFSAFMGSPVIDAAGCDRCGRCAAVCPAGAISLVPEGIEVSLERCVFCATCAGECPGHISMSKEFELAARKREDLRVVFRHG